MRATRGGLLLAGVVVIAALVASMTRRAAASTTSPSSTAAPLRSEAEIRELDIAYYLARAERDPTGGTDLAHVGALHLARSRASGDPRDVALAEEAARRSLRNRPSHNEQAAQVLQSALLAQHRFGEALVLARAALAGDSTSAPLRAAVGEIEMELGNYDAARASFTNLHAALGDPAIAPRLARWAEIEGRPDDARRYLRAALAAVRRQPLTPAEQLAWYWMRVGDVELRTGHPAAADSAYLAGLAAHPDDHRLLAALAQSAAVQQDRRRAIDFGERAIAITLDPGTLGILSDAYVALGDTVKGAELARVMDVVVLKQPGAYHRAWSLFLLDHGRHLGTVSRKIRQELEDRHDVYAYDLLAWSLHKQGRHAAAATAMMRALGEGTLDARMLFHAGMIERALGNTDAARGHLERALAVNPFFHPTQPADARAMLDSIRTGR